MHCHPERPPPSAGDTAPAMAHWDFPRSSASIDILLQLAGEHGVSADACLAGTRITRDQLLLPDTMVSARDELQVARNLQTLVADPAGLGLQAGQRYHLSTYGIWGFALLSSPTLRSAIEIGLRYLDLTFIFCRLRVVEDADSLSLLLDDSEIPADMRRFMIERDAAAIMTIQRELFSGELPFRVMAFSFPADGDSARYETLFGTLPLFASPPTRAVMPQALLDMPLPQANPITAAFCEMQCRQLVARRHERSGLSGQVRDLLLRNPRHMPDMADAAGQLCLSLRSLHRHLQAEGTTWRQLVDEVREALAEELLGGGRLSVSEVSERLGYAEPASFLQAFRRWKGMTPGRWQRHAGTKFHHLR